MIKLMNDLSFIIFLNKITSKIGKSIFYIRRINVKNRAFLLGDAVKVSFFVRNGKLIMDEECYFFLMASMRKMRMNIPLTYTLEFFQSLFQKEIIEERNTERDYQFQVFRNNDGVTLAKSSVSYFYEVTETDDVLAVHKRPLELDLLRKLTLIITF
jgi:branched-chain amino acid aminotransferase